MSASPYSAELDYALRAVHAASLLTKSVLRSLDNNVRAETKADDSPVTIADFAAQALLISALHAVYPDDGFIGEESADALRENEALATRVWELVVQAKEHGKEHAHARHDEKSEAHANAFPASKEHMLHLIDLGGKAHVTGQGRVWIMDPIDGTATFLQGQQYAVALCLLVDGVQHVAVVACPNLALDVHRPLRETRIHEHLVDQTGHGILVSATKGHGTYMRSIHPTHLGQPHPITLTTLPPQPLSTLAFVESPLGKTTLSQPEHQAVATALAAPWPSTTLWSQQMKYIALTLGSADVMLRIPRSKDRFTYIWDHAGGHLLYEEAGGLIRDFDNMPIDFSTGRKLSGHVNHGMLAATPHVFHHVLGAVNTVLAKRNP